MFQLRQTEGADKREKKSKLSGNYEPYVHLYSYKKINQFSM